MPPLKRLWSGGRLQQDRLVGQTNLFGALEPSSEDDKKTPYPEVEEWPEKLCLAYEKSVSASTCQGILFDRYTYDIQRTLYAALRNPIVLTRTQYCCWCCDSQSVNGRRATVKDGWPVSIEDLSGRAEVVIFSRLFYEDRNLLSKVMNPSFCRLWPPGGRW